MATRAGVHTVSSDSTMTGIGAHGSEVDLAAPTADVARREADGSRRDLIEHPFGTA